MYGARIDAFAACRPTEGHLACTGRGDCNASYIGGGLRRKGRTQYTMVPPFPGNEVAEGAG